MNLNEILIFLRDFADVESSQGFLNNLTFLSHSSYSRKVRKKSFNKTWKKNNLQSRITYK